MSKWKSRYELAEALKARAAIGRNLTISPATARLIAMLIVGESVHVGHGSAWHVDLFAQGSAVLELGRDGKPMRMAAWAQSTSVARSALYKLWATYPESQFEQRRGSWVEATTDDRQDRPMKLILDLPTDLSLALRRRANMRDLSPEDAAIEILATAMQATGEIEGEVAGRPPLRIVKTEGKA